MTLIEFIDRLNNFADRERERKEVKLIEEHKTREH